MISPVGALSLRALQCQSLFSISSIMTHSYSPCSTNDMNFHFCFHFSKCGGVFKCTLAMFAGLSPLPLWQNGGEALRSRQRCINMHKERSQVIISKGSLEQHHSMFLPFSLLQPWIQVQCIQKHTMPKYRLTCKRIWRTSRRPPYYMIGM